jgi:hypothetical protein
MKLIKFSQMKRKKGSMMHFVNDDLHEALDDELDDLISEIFDDSAGLEIDKELILILEICLDEYFDEDLADECQKFVSEKI